ncbi:MAG: hypothetical protein LBC09_02675 [Helicobacteraceae bacterium]|jgi:hypothetical protein|nr:hypothetical protein [Helicobacteraceae bacterium]
MTALLLCAILIGGFSIGFVCWRGCFVAVDPIASALFDLASLESIGVKIVRAAVFIFLVCLTSLLLLIYPIGFYVFASARLSPYLSVALSFATSFLGWLCLLYMRRIIKRGDTRSQAARL